MYLCYIDESGTSSLGNTSHFVLAGLSIPIWYWKTCDEEINQIKKRFHLESTELHTGWIMRKYLEQSEISNFDKLSFPQRTFEVEKWRKLQLLQAQKSKGSDAYKQLKKNLTKTRPYVHLTFEERKEFLEEIARCVGGWRFARLFAECIDKVHFPSRSGSATIDEQAFEQIVSRFEQFLRHIKIPGVKHNYGLLIHDNNETIAKKHTELMKKFHSRGTLWTKITNLIETPLFVDSQLTSMVQIADLCAYSLRRYLENHEELLFNHIFRRADLKSKIAVGVRHYTSTSCEGRICAAHRPRSTASTHSTT